MFCFIFSQKHEAFARFVHCATNDYLKHFFALCFSYSWCLSAFVRVLFYLEQNQQAYTPITDYCLAKTQRPEAILTLKFP